MANPLGLENMNSIIIPDDHQVSIQKILERLPNDIVGQKGAVLLHIGAHLGEEVPFYLAHGFTEIYLVEANPEVAVKLSDKFSSLRNIYVINKAISDKEGVVELIVHETKKGSVESSSLLMLKKLGEIVPVFNSEKKVLVPSTTLDALVDELKIQEKIKLLCIDIQGAELMALSCGSKLLETVEAVICEVNLIETYEGCALEADIDSLMARSNFYKEFSVYHELYDSTGSFPAWGECLWLKQNSPS